MLVVIALVLLGLVARAEAAPAAQGEDDSIELARTYAQALIGDDDDTPDDIADEDIGSPDDIVDEDADDDVSPADLEPADLLDDNGDDTRALLDAEQTPGGALAGDDATFAAAPAGADEVYEASLRHQRPSPWGRLDLGLSLRRAWNAPAHSPVYQSEELWLLATWRR